MFRYVVCIYGIYGGSRGDGTQRSRRSASLIKQSVATDECDYIHTSIIIIDYTLTILCFHFFECDLKTGFFLVVLSLLHTVSLTQLMANSFSHSQRNICGAFFPFSLVHLFDENEKRKKKAEFDANEEH